MRVKSPTALEVALTVAVATADITSRIINHRGYWRFCSILAGFFANSQERLTVSADDFAFQFPLNDSYWLRLLGSGYTYEPELAYLLYFLRAQRYVFLDCGANLGYWSARVCSAAYGSQRAIAIEADERNYHGLVENSTLNGSRFQTMHRALWGRSGVRMNLFGDADYPTDFSLLSNDGNKPVRGTVETICLDDIVLSEEEAKLPVVIKLDVEGVEGEAMGGAQRILSGDSIVLYEDHGADRTHASTRWFFEHGGFTIWAITERGLFEVTQLSDLDRLKVSLTRGYNFAAAHVDSTWHERLQAVVVASPGHVR